MTRSIVSVLACLALAASACGGPSGQTPASSGGGNNVVVVTPQAQNVPTSVATAVATAQTAQQPQGQASGTQEITINALQGEPDNIDPNRSSFATEAAVVRQVFEPLLAFDKDLKPV